MYWAAERFTRIYIPDELCRLPSIFSPRLSLPKHVPVDNFVFLELCMLKELQFNQCKILFQVREICFEVGRKTKSVLQLAELLAIKEDLKTAGGMKLLSFGIDRKLIEAAVTMIIIIYRLDIKSLCSNLSNSNNLSFIVKEVTRWQIYQLDQP